MKRRNAVLGFVLLVFLAAQLSRAQQQQPGVAYTVSLAGAAQHLVHVRMELPGGADERQIQLPVWNALYQVRDFAQYVRAVTAKDPAGKLLPVRLLDKTTWQFSGAARGAIVEYDTFADQHGPFGAQLNTEHAFFNLAEILMYPVGGKNALMTVSFSDIPAGWKIATPLPAAESRPATFLARNYDHLVDSPVEIGTFQETTLQESGATYRIVVDGNPADYDLDPITRSLRKIVVAAVAWMKDRPFEQYTFIYHISPGPVGGGMEHAYATAIDISTNSLRNGLRPLESVTAHEFFHLWNVKRIRPASLEPVDFTKENYTRALWFSEGVDSAVTEYILLNAGLIDENAFLQHFARQILQLQSRPAHRLQSVEESSLDAWLEKYASYNQPDRSVNYYNKGEVLGFLLDLAIRQASNDRASLRDVFQWMNQHYAKQGRFFPDSAGVQEAAEAVTGANFGSFFQKYVAGVEELPYDDLLKTVGLRLDRRKVPAPAWGFTINFGSEGPVVSAVEPGSEAQKAGLAEGDMLLTINDKPIPRGRLANMPDLKPGDTVNLRVRGRAGERDLTFVLGSREEDDFALVSLENVTAEQRARRTRWLNSQDRGTGAAAQ